MSVIEDYETEAAKHPEGSTARKLLTWAAMELPDRAARIAELEEDDDSRLRECEKLREALLCIKAALEVVGTHARNEAFHLNPGTFARDFAPFTNIMVAHGVEPYAKPKRTKRAA